MALFFFAQIYYTNNSLASIYFTNDHMIINYIPNELEKLNT
jgi:hypothetical protein